MGDRKTRGYFWPDVMLHEHRACPIVSKPKVLARAIFLSVRMIAFLLPDWEAIRTGISVSLISPCAYRGKNIIEDPEKISFRR